MFRKRSIARAADNSTKLSGEMTVVCLPTFYMRGRVRTAAVANSPLSFEFRVPFFKTNAESPTKLIIFHTYFIVSVPQLHRVSNFLRKRSAVSSGPGAIC